MYPSDPVEMTELLERCFTGPRGPGHLPTRKRSSERHLRAVIVPHAAWVYSGAIAAHAYAALAADRAPETVLLLGVNHQARGAPAALGSLDWQTPIGPVATDPDLLRALRRSPVEVDDRAHATEHSLEVQMPFLEYVLPKPRVVALSVSWGSLAFLTEVAAVVRRALRGRDVLLLASTDLSHYLPAEEAQRLDRLALDAIASRRPDTLYDTIRSHDISMCGIAPTTVLLAALEGEPLEVQELRYGHSGEVEPMADVVGYASLLLASAAPL
jgi:MEMO1 family protein